MLAFPNAKINLGLHITEKRPDGYHNLESCFYPVGWTDVLEIIESPNTKFTSSGINIPGEPTSNLCLKAYYALKKDFDLPPVHIHLHKVIPIGAGLGGGSADAAFTIKTLNEKFGLQLSMAQMEDYVRPIGSDCAFFIHNYPRYCYDKGDQFENTTVSLKGYFMVLVYPAIHVSTAQAYAGIKAKMPIMPLKQILTLPVTQWKDLLINDFEAGVFSHYPVLSTIKGKLYQEGALYTAMSGSGSTIFGIFKEEIAVKDIFPSECIIWSGSIK